MMGLELSLQNDNRLKLSAEEGKAGRVAFG